MRLAHSKFHFIGIGGIGMCGLAEILHGIGAKVTGSDMNVNSNTERLESLGIQIYKGHRAENVGDADVIVYSSAVKFDNPEIVMARGQQIPLIPRAEALAELMRLKRGLAVAGTHGKTTTTSMVASIFLAANTNPTIVVGGRFDRINSTALWGPGEWLIAEADESDGSFLKLAPEIAIITNIDSDHMDHFKTFENLQKSFQDFALKVPFYGAGIVCGDDPEVKKLFQGFSKKIIFYGFENHNDWIVNGSNGIYQIKGEGQTYNFQLSVSGRHNALNASAAFIAALESGISAQNCIEGLQSFHGVDRRFHFKGEVGGIKVYDDYGHHPTEVKAVLQAFREKFPRPKQNSINNLDQQPKLVVAFQPHRYSRTQHCWHEFTTCFADADKVILLDIYPAGENPIAGISAAALVQDMKHPNAEYWPKDQVFPQKIATQLKAGDVFLTLGAGDGWKLGMQVLEVL